MINLLDYDQDALTALFAERGEKPFRAKQALRWVHHGLVDRIDAMTDLAKSTRAALSVDAEIRAPAVVRDSTASDGTRKWLLDVGGANAVEAVFIPEDDRGTLCVSSQAGCALDCAFCSTGKQGFNRNLSVAEIIGQLWLANRALLADSTAAPWVAQGRHPITNVVMMGMGEPLTNFDNVVAAMKLMLDDNAYGLSRRRVTLSTSGIVPAMDRLRDACPVALAVSLHAPNDALRDKLVPINRKYPLQMLLAACVRYIEKAPRDFVTFEYVMLDRVNDAPEQARELVRLLRDVPCKINLIPFNPFPDSGFVTSSRNRIVAFQRILQDAGMVATVRKTRGEDIDAACGQLAGQVQDKTRRTIKVRAITTVAVSQPVSPMRPSLIAVAASTLVLALVLSACSSTETKPDAAAAARAQQRAQPVPQPQQTPPAVRARMHTDLAAGYYERGQMDVALDELNMAVTLDQNYAPAYNIYGLVYSVLGENAKAEQNFTRALELAPNDSDFHHNWGWYLCQHKREREALAQFEIAVRNPLYRSPEIALVNAGRCAITLGDVRQAESYFRRALVAQPGNALAGYGLALIAYKESRYADARNWMKGAMQSTNPQPEVLYLGMCIERKLGDSQAELSYVSQMKNRFPDAPETKAITVEGCQ